MGGMEGEAKSPDPKTNRFATWRAVIFLIQFFGCCLAIFVNAFLPFLNEDAFQIIALVLFGELVLLYVAEKSIQAIAALRRAMATRKRVLASTDETHNSD
jgi:hypothetical protein